jgi:hypothetical protein
MTNEDFDVEAIYDEQISPLMTQIIALCKEHQIPMLASFLYSRSDTGIKEETNRFCSTLLNQFDGRFSRHLMMANEILYGRLPKHRISFSPKKLDWFAVAVWVGAFTFCGLIWWGIWLLAGLDWALILQKVRLLP